MNQSPLTDNIAASGQMIESFGNGSSSRNRLKSKAVFDARGRYSRYVAGALATVMLLSFLSFSRWLDSRREQPDTTIRLLSGIDAVSAEVPPPPPPSDPPPPPPKTPPLPKLDIQINSPAPPIKATTDPNVRPTMMMATFSTNRPQERKRMTFSLSDLDGQPKLLNRPRIVFPESLRKRGLNEGRVCLEVKIHPNGQVDVLRVVESDDSEFTTLATNFATRARFSPPTKDGRPVAAQFHWPIVLR